jgi:hypothetical protein
VVSPACYVPAIFECLRCPSTRLSRKNVTYCQLAGDPTKFSGKRIRIQAIYSYLFEVSALRPRTCCAEHDIDIWVDFDSQLEGESKRLFNKFPKGMGFVLAVFVGTIETGDAYGTGQRVHFFVEHIEEMKQKANPPQGRFPAWIPQDCKPQLRRLLSPDTSADPKLVKSISGNRVRCFGRFTSAPVRAGFHLSAAQSP